MALGSPFFNPPKVSQQTKQRLEQAATNSPPIKQGERSEAVRAVQEALLRVGESIPDGATGYFGNQTLQAVLSYQAKLLRQGKHGKPDGDVGQKTLAGLDAQTSGTQPVSPPVAPPPAVTPFICGPDVTDQVVDTWTKVRGDFDSLTFIQKIQACNSIFLPFKRPENLGDLDWPSNPFDLDKWKKLAQQFADIDSWDTLPLFQGFSGWLRSPPVYDPKKKGPCATPSSDTIGGNPANNFDDKHEDASICSNTVQMAGKCWLNGTVNYGTFGVMVRACSDFARTDIRLALFDTPKIVYSLEWAKMLIRAYKRFGGHPEGADLPIAWTEATFTGGPKGVPSVPENRPKCKCSCGCKGNIVPWDYVWTPHKPRPAVPPWAIQVT
jgi:hypothetical protein